MEEKDKAALEISVSVVTSPYNITVKDSCTSFNLCTLGTTYMVTRLFLKQMYFVYFSLLN